MGIDVYTLNIALAKAWPQVEMGIYFRYPGSQPPRGGAQLLPGWGGPADTRLLGKTAQTLRFFSRGVER